MPRPPSEFSGTEARYRAIVEAQVELISLARPDGTLVYVNPAYARHFELTPDQMIGRSLFDQVPEVDLPAVRRAIAEVLASGKPLSTENRIMNGSGQARWVAWTNGIQHEDGKVLLHSVGRDITERKVLEQEVLDSEAFLREITDSLPQRIAYVDRDRRYRFVNLAHCQRFARRREEIIGRTRDELLGRPAPEPIRDRIQAVLEGEAQRFEYNESVGDAAHHYEIQLIPRLGPDGQVWGYFYTGLDITDRARAEQALREVTLEAQRRSDILRLVTEAMPATVVVVGVDGRYRFANGAFEHYCGLPREQIVGRTVVEILGAEEVARRRPFIERALGGESVTFALDYAGAEGTAWRELTCIPLRLNGGAVDGFVGISTDIARQRREQARLTELSQTDPLTGLLNRAGFEECIERRTQEGRAAMLGLLYIDLDRFKPINDQHGHTIGDRLLQAVARRLSGLVRPTDAVARPGGDEFAILLVDVGVLANAEAVADKVVAAIATPFEIDGRKLEIGASVGVAVGIDPVGDWHKLIQRADAMLYRAKESGRGRRAS